MPRTFHVFHQNMMVFGGGSVARNAAFGAAFGAMNLGTATDLVLVAGFTEICNSVVAPGALGTLVATLDPDLVANNTVVVGISAAGKAEYIVMATFNEDAANRFAVAAYGKVIGTADGQTWTCYPTTELAANVLPPSVKPDSRGLAYVVGTLASATDPAWNGKSLVVAFMHNMYGTGDRYGGMTRLPGALGAIYAKHGLPAGAPYVLGGDFNVMPRTVKDRSGAFSMVPAFAQDAASKPIATTLHHPYDFFFAYPALPSANVHVWTQSRGKGAGVSDHGAVSIALDPALL